MKTVTTFLAVVVGLICCAALAASAQAATFVVHPGQSIQAAVDAASPGDTILVDAGVYHQNVTILKNRITLRGAGIGKTVLEPASPPTPSVCTSPTDGGGLAVEGICIAGQFTDNGSPGKPVEGTVVQGFTIAHFSDFGLILVNARHSKIMQVEAHHNGSYGISGFVLSDIQYLNNIAHDNGAPGFYIGDSPQANALVVGNTSYLNGVGGPEGLGFLFRDSTSGTVMNNLAWGNCAGFVFVDSPENPAPAANWTASGNTARANNGSCTGEGPGGAPPFSGVGFGVLGTHHVVLNRNTAVDNHPTGPSIPPAGITVISTKAIGGADPTDNHIENNILSNNSPFDIFYDGSGSGNTFTNNSCSLSIPASIC